MAIPQIPKQHRTSITPISKEEAGEKFLDEIESKSKPKPAPKNRKPMPVYFKPELKERIIQAAEEMGVSQSTWISFAVMEKLARDGK
jgi:predicted HicB family RNase H-like nuclease